MTAPYQQLGDDSPLPAASIGDRITDRLRDAIVFAELLPGTRLKQEDLARKFGTSRVPLREAMRQLAAEGLIEWVSNRSAVVRSLEKGELRELFELAGILEPRGTYFGVPHLTDEDVATLHRLNARLLEGQADVRSWYETNLRFHLLPILRSGQRNTIEMVIAIRSNLNRFFMIPSFFGDPGDEWHRYHQPEHRALLDAFERRDAGAAREIVAADWRQARADWLPHLERKLESQTLD